MITMKRLLALLLALAMVIPNCLSLVYAEEVVEEIVEEVVEEPAEEITEAPAEEVVEETEAVEEEDSAEVIEEEPAFEQGASGELADAVAEPEAEPVFTSYCDPDAEDDSEQQFADYANNIFFPSPIMTVGTDGRDALPEDSVARELYDGLVTPIANIANGLTNSAIIDVPMSKNMDRSSFAQAINALLVDMPYNLYWYDKVTGSLYSSSGSSNNWTCTVALTVSSAYSNGQKSTRGGLTDYYLTTDTAKTSAANSAAAYARTVATETAFADYVAAGNQCLTPYDRLMAYIAWIEKAVDYDYDAVNSSNSNKDYFSAVNCNPWQLIYVFDRNADDSLNTSTKVVCEGYSKALQFLCDYAYSQGHNVPHVFSVTGDMFYLLNGSGGRHMWNIAQMEDGNRYMVDVTNHDRTSPFATILRGGSYTEVPYTGTSSYTAWKYSFPMSTSAITYEYDKETMALFSGTSALKLAQTDYIPALSVAKVGSEGYASLEAALAAVKTQEDKTITLLQNITTAVPVEQEVTILKNGFAASLTTTSGYARSEDSEKYTFVTAKARIGDTGYATLTDALAATGAGNTVTLLRDVTLSETLVIEKSITLDLNGKSLTGTVALATENATLQAAEGLNVTSKLEGYTPKYENGTWKLVKEGLFKLKGANMTLGGSLAMNFFIDPADLEETENYHAVITKKYADGRADVTVTVQQDDWIWYNTAQMYYVTFNGVAAKEMTDAVTVTIYNDAGTAVSEQWVDSVRDYNMRMINKELAASETNDKKVALYVDMLNYGATAQNYFDDYHSDDLANSQLTNVHQAYATTNVSMADARVQSDAYKGTNLRLESEIILNLFFDPEIVDQNMSAVATFTDHYGNAKTVNIAGSEFGTYKGLIYVPVKGMAVADCGQLVTLTVYNADGTELTTVKDSVESYVFRMTETDELYTSIMKFATSAYGYFH